MQCRVQRERERRVKKNFIISIFTIIIIAASAKLYNTFLLICTCVLSCCTFYVFLQLSIIPNLWWRSHSVKSQELHRHFCDRITQLTCYFCYFTTTLLMVLWLWPSSSCYVIWTNFLRSAVITPPQQLFFSNYRRRSQVKNSR